MPNVKDRVLSPVRRNAGMRRSSLALLTALIATLLIALPGVAPAFASGGTLVQGPTGAVIASGGSLAFGLAVRSGDVIVVAIVTSGGSVTSVTDTLGSTFTEEVGIHPATNNLGYSPYIYCATLSSGGADSVSVVVSGGNLLLNIYEVSGVTTAGLNTGSASGSGTSVAASTASFTQPYGFLVSMGSTGSQAEAVTPGSGFTLAPAVGGNTEIFSEYSTSGVSGSSTTFPLTLGTSASWDQVGVALGAPVSVPEFPFPLAAPMLFAASVVLYFALRRSNLASSDRP